jgi:myo-inositol-1(or 4)-monophosphatase
MTDGPWQIRKTGSAAIECAFVATGLLQVSRFDMPNLWDVAGGIALVQAAGGEVHTHGPKGWSRFRRFETENTDGTQADLRAWRQPLVLGRAQAVSQLLGLL